jgi:CheY-like chemotaxis protein
MTRTLERMGHRVTGCSSPEVALEKFVADPDAFDLVVSDMAMPGLSGLELAERVLQVRPQLPFIITSGFVDAADVERARAVGVRQTIIKPNTVDELCGALAAILREQQVSTAATPVPTPA